MDYLIYIGDGAALLPVPARNLTKHESEMYGVERLLASGLYKMAETPKAAATKKAAKTSKELNNDSYNE